MSLSVPALTSAVSALRVHLRRVDRAAQVIAASGLQDLPELAGETAPPPADEPAGRGVGTALAGDFTDAMVTMLMAQRAALAQLRSIQMKERMLKDLVDPEHDGPSR